MISSQRARPTTGEEATRRSAPARVLSIVIPALNEEEAIGDTLRRCLAARPFLQADAGLADVEVIVVSDGSTDRTEEIALEFPSVSVIAFERNRGYGAAIKCGFDHARGDLLAFLDADGTCDPEAFGGLCRALEAEGASVSLGLRMGAHSEMPLVRRLGNRLFAGLLGLLSSRAVRDTASGMRVIRRSALPDLYPLPDGLHFTPAMSARVLIEDKIKLTEVPMPYAERVGQSKLSVIKDGLRFLRTIIQAAFCYRPGRLLIPAAILAAGGAVLVGALPVTFYARFERLEEWMIYRVLLSATLLATAVLLACAGVLADHIAALAHGRPAIGAAPRSGLTWIFAPRARLFVAGLALAVAVIVVWPGIAEYVSSGRVDMHWSRAVLAGLLVPLVVAYVTTALLLDLLALIRFHRTADSGVRAPDRFRPATAPRA